jgi:hypothetical protein
MILVKNRKLHLVTQCSYFVGLIEARFYRSFECLLSRIDKLSLNNLVQ